MKEDRNRKKLHNKILIDKLNRIHFFELVIQV